MELRKRIMAAGLAAALGTTGISAAAGPVGATDDDAERTFTVRIENVSGALTLSQSGRFAVPDGADGPGVAAPGDSYSFRVRAMPGQHLSLASMLAQTNDWFIGAGGEGVALYDDEGNPVSGDITSNFYVLDAGTEIDQPVGQGDVQAPRQSGPNTGAADPDRRVRIVDSAPAISDLIKVTAEPKPGNAFVIRVENRSADTALASPLTPGVFGVHTNGSPIYAIGQPDAGAGLESIAEDGDPTELLHSLTAWTGTATPLAPGVYAAHADGVQPIFTPGARDRGEGLEGLAEDGSAGTLADNVARVASDSGVFAVPAGGDGPGPLFPGESYEFTVTAKKGERLNFATMFVQSNDWFFSPPAAGIPFYDERGNALTGDITNRIHVYDAGTERDQFPGFGSDQAPRQAGPNTGDDQDNPVRLLGRGVGRYIKVTISSPS